MKIGYYGGTWDVLHVGHINALSAARSLCDHLIVGVAINEIYSELRGQQPARDWADRMAVIKALRCVDTVIPYDSEDPYDVWQRHHFDIFFTSEEYLLDPAKQEVMTKIMQTGVEIVYLSRTPHVSSSSLKSKIQLADPQMVFPEFA